MYCVFGLYFTDYARHKLEALARYQTLRRYVLIRLILIELKVLIFESVNILSQK